MTNGAATQSSESVKPERPDRQRILIIKPSSLGDVATTLPLLCDLKRAYPHATIDWLVAPAFAGVIQGHDALHEVVLFDRKGLASWWRSMDGLRRLRALTGRLKSAKYDCVIDAQGLFRSGWLSYVTGASMRIGFADAREGGRYFYTHKVPIRRRESLAVDRMRALLDPLGITHNTPPEYRVPLDPQAVPKMNAIVPEGGFGIIPGGRGAGKRWAADGYAAVISVLAELHPIALLGSADERELCEYIAGKSGSSGHARINLAGQTSIPEMIAALARCSLVIGNDTGPLHVAVALGRTVIGLYGSTDPRSVGPYGQLENVVRFDATGSWMGMWRNVIGRVTFLQSRGVEFRSISAS